MRLEEKNKNVGCVGFKFINFIIKFQFEQNLTFFKIIVKTCNLGKKNKNKNMGCVGFKFKSF